MFTSVAFASTRTRSELVPGQFVIHTNCVGDFNFCNIIWYDADGFGATARCANLPEKELKLVETLRENFFLQHVTEATRQRGSNTPHTLDLILTTDNCLSEIEYLSPLGMSDHSVLKFDYKFNVKNIKQTINFS